MIDISNIRIPSNYVLIKPDPDHEKVGEIIIGKDNPTEARHYSITGTVLATPEKLIYNGRKIAELKKGAIIDNTEIQRLHKQSIEFDVPMELKTGDKVWFHYNEQFNARTQGQGIETKDGYAIFMRYDSLFAYKRIDHPLTPVNGLIFVEPITDIVVEDGRNLIKHESGIDIVVLNKEKKLRKQQLGKVIRVGVPCDGYLNHGLYDSDCVQEGDTICYARQLATPFEYDLHRTVEDNRELFKVRRKDIYYIIKQEPVCV